MSLKGLKFSFLCHEIEGATGFPASFAPYLQGAGAKLVYIKFPFFNSVTKSIWIEKYDGERLLSKKRSWIRFYQPQLLSFAKDITWLLSVGWIHVIGSDFVLASDSLMGIAGLLFRKLGLVKRVTYLIVDYSPTRFSNSLVERMYVFLDSFVARHADSVWTMSLPMLEARERDGRIKLSQVRYRLAPMGNNANITFAKGELPYNKRDLIFVGNPNAQNVRADFLIDVAKALANRNQEFRLIFYGPGKTDHLKQKAKALGVEKQVELRGSIEHTLDLERLMAGGGLGLAPYDSTLKDSFSKFADPSKIKIYLGCGLPVVTSDVPPIAQDLQRTGAGRIADYTPEGFAQTIINLWSSDTQFERARVEALRMGMEFSWPKIFDRLMQEEGFSQNGENR